jgi:hypothetical protein
MQNEARTNKAQSPECGLREFLRRQLSDAHCCVPLDSVIRDCYREVMALAVKTHLHPARLQEKLCEVATALIKRRFGGTTPLNPPSFS